MQTTTNNYSPKETTRLDCNTSLSNWLKSIEDPDLWSNKPYNENDQPFFDMEMPEIEIKVPYLQRRKGISLTNLFSLLSL